MNRPLIMLIMFVSLALSGCATTHPADVDGLESPYQAKGRIQWNSSKIKHSLEIDKASVDRTGNGLLRVRLVLRNKTRKDIVVDIRTVFTDEQGFEKERTNWEPIVCNARTQTPYETVSLGSEVFDYQVIIREPKEFSWNP